MLVSIIIPWIRKEGFERCLKAVHDTIGLDASEYEVVAEQDTERIGCNKMVKRLVDRATGQYIVFLSDDVIPQVGMVHEAIATMKTLPDGWGLVGLNDGFTDGNTLSQQWMVDRRMIEALGGELLHTGYWHAFSDNEINVRAKRLGRFAWCRASKYIHDHPMFRGEPLTGDYAQAYSPEWMAHDRALFEKRVGWGDIAIGTRLSRIDPAFFWSWTSLLLGGKRPGDVVINPAVELPHSCACNVLAHWFMQTACDSLLLVDDDMQFSPESLETLRMGGQENDVMSGLFACRRWPHRPCVLLDVGADGRPQCPQQERIQEGIIPAKYVGFGFTLIRRWVIQKLIEQKGETLFEFHKDKGEDGLFSEEAKAIGARLAVNTRAEIGHRTSKTVYFSARDHKTTIGDNTFGLDLK